MPFSRLKSLACLKYACPRTPTVASLPLSPFGGRVAAPHRTSRHLITMALKAAASSRTALRSTSTASGALLRPSASRPALRRQIAGVNVRCETLAATPAVRRGRISALAVHARDAPGEAQNNNILPRSHRIAPPLPAGSVSLCAVVQPAARDRAQRGAPAAAEVPRQDHRGQVWRCSDEGPHAQGESTRCDGVRPCNEPPGRSPPPPHALRLA
jgi:hypothetical protein